MREDLRTTYAAASFFPMSDGTITNEITKMLFRYRQIIRNTHLPIEESSITL